MSTPTSHVIHNSICSNISAIHIRNTTGERGEGFGTPILVLPTLISFLSLHTAKDLSPMKLDIQFVDLSPLLVCHIGLSTLLFVTFFKPPFTYQKPYSGFPPIHTCTCLHYYSENHFKGGPCLNCTCNGHNTVVIN